MKESLSPPDFLKNLQLWFADTITQPMIEDTIQPVSLKSGKAIVDEAERWIVPSKTLPPHKRIEIYNQQYWWRLLNIMQDNFPLVVRLFGYRDFNLRLAEPYLAAHPPEHWSLNHLGDHFTHWIQQNYHEKDRKFVTESAYLDHAYNMSYIAKELPSINVIKATQEGAEKLLTEKIRLQPHLFLMEFKWALPQFRDTLLQESIEYWEEHDFPELKKGKRCIYALYRAKEMYVAYKEISIGAFLLLKQFEKANTIENVCSWLETQEGPLLEEAKENLHFWFQEWTILGWLGVDHPPKAARSS